MKTIKLFITFSLILSLSALFSPFLPVEASAQGGSERENHRTVLVAFPETPGFSETYEDGSRGGVVYDFLMEIAKYTGWEYEFVEGSPEELLDLAMAGELDLVGGMFHLKELEPYFSYPKYSSGYNYTYLLSRKDDTSIKNFDMNTLDKKTIGVFDKATDKIKRLKLFLEFNGIECQLKYYSSTEAYKDCLDKGEVDLILASDTMITPSYYVAASFPSETYYFVTAIDRPELLAELDYALESIYSANPNFSLEIYERHFPITVPNALLLSPEEEDFIANAGPVRVSLVKDNYPLSYISPEGEKKGVIPDFFSLLGQKTGLSFTYVYSDTYEQALNAVRDGAADLAGGFMDSERDALDSDFVLTRPYLNLDENVIKNQTVSTLTGDLRAAVVNGRPALSGVKHELVSFYPSFEKCVEAVSRQEADYTLVPSSLAGSILYARQYKNVILEAANNHNMELSIALPRKNTRPLYSILSKAVNSVPPDEADHILTQNLAFSDSGRLSLKELAAANPLAFVLMTCIFFLLLSALVLLFLLSHFNSRLMRVKLEKAEENSRLKSDFLSRMSHEIRTPMNAIIGLTEIAQLSGEATPSLEDKLKKINTTSHFLLSMINNILDMSKIENEKMVLSRDPFYLQKLTEELRDMFQLQAEQKNLESSFTFQGENTALLGDPIRLKQILANLLSNAIKFTQPGGRVALSIKALPPEPESDMAVVCFSVTDTGLGIDPIDLGRIFSSYEQVASRLNTGNGTGLGLPISKSLVELMGGQLEVESTPEKGSDFHFAITFPLGPPEENRTENTPAPSGRPARQQLSGMRLLLVEDNEMNAEIAISLLELEGIVSEWAMNGQEAVERFLSQPAGYYDAILMDIQMPVMDGLTATQKIRASSREDAFSIPIIAMTANTFDDDRERAALAGMDHFLPKPFEPDTLYRLLSSVCISGTSKP